MFLRWVIWYFHRRLAAPTKGRLQRVILQFRFPIPIRRLISLPAQYRRFNTSLVHFTRIDGRQLGHFGHFAVAQRIRRIGRQLQWNLFQRYLHFFRRHRRHFAIGTSFTAKWARTIRFTWASQRVAHCQPRVLFARSGIRHRVTLSHLTRSPINWRLRANRLTYTWLPNVNSVAPNVFQHGSFLAARLRRTTFVRHHE